jgi:hypothetical protein
MAMNDVFENIILPFCDPFSLGKLAQVCREYNSTVSRNSVFQKNAKLHLDYMNFIKDFENSYEFVTSQFYRLGYTEIKKAKKIKCLPLIEMSSDKILFKWLLSVDDRRRGVPFRYACKNGHLEIVKRMHLLYYTVDNTVDTDPVCRGFINACKNGHKLIAQWLFSMKRWAFLGISSDWEIGEVVMKASVCAREYGHTDTVQWLDSISRKYNLNYEIAKIKKSSDSDTDTESDSEID